MHAHRVLTRLFIAVMLLAHLSAMSQQSVPLVVKRQGSFFVGGEKKWIREPATKELPEESGDITVNQMYVQYQIPIHGDHHVPMVMVHGCCLSSKTWETTPDGRMGWGEYFVRHDRSVYLADQVSRARSGFDPTAFYQVRLAKLPVTRLPSIERPTHQLAWKVFRLGPKFGTAFADQQFPMQAIGELYKQMIPDLNSTLPQDSNPTWTDMAMLGAKLDGAILMGHSESGFFPERAALIESKGVRGIVSIETECETGLTSSQIAVLVKIPTLIMFGDHLDDVVFNLPSGRWSWPDALASCERYADQIQKSGGDAQVMHLPSIGIKGNSHMLMQDKNSDSLADLVIAWIDRHVEPQADRDSVKLDRTKALR